MEISKREWPLLSICGIKSRIDTRPDYQRPALADFTITRSNLKERLCGVFPGNL
jgi:hypothetical protein